MIPLDALDYISDDFLRVSRPFTLFEGFRRWRGRDNHTVSCGDVVGCLLIVESFGDVIPIDISYLIMSHNHGIFVFLRFGFLRWVVCVVIV